MARLELPGVAQAGAQVGASIHGDFLAMVNELQPNDRKCFVKVMTATMVRRFDAEGNITPGRCRCQLVRS